MFTTPPATARLPYPYRPEFEVLNSLMHGLAASADWPAAVRSARPWVQAVRDNPAPFWEIGRASCRERV